MQDEGQAELRSPDISSARDASISTNHSLFTDLMERVKRAFKRTPSYEPLLQNGDANGNCEDAADGGEWDDGREGEKKFSGVDYAIFMLIGVAMLWAW